MANPNVRRLFLGRRRVLAMGALAPLATTARAADDFPADPYKAPFPSPPGSQIPGAPYLRDHLGTLFTMDTHNPPHYYPRTGPGSQGNAFAGYYVYINGGLANPDNGAPDNDPWHTVYTTQLIVDGKGVVFAKAPLGMWFAYDGTKFVAAGVPNITAPAATKMPPDPPRASVAPGSSGKVIRVGPSQPVRTIAAGLAAAGPGDTLQLDPVTFSEGFVVKLPIHFKGTPASAGSTGTVISGAGLAGSAYPMQGRGGVVPTTDCIFSDISFRDWGLLSKRSDLTSAIRPAGQQWLTCERCRFTGNQCAIGTDGGGTANIVVTLNECIAENNGLGDGYSHNYYFGNGTVRVLSTNSSSTAPRGGHAFKSRAWGLTISGGTFDASDATPIDIPDGTAVPFSISGATIDKSAGDANHGVLGYAAESTNNGTAGGAVSSTIHALCPGPFVLVNAGSVSFAGSSFTGNKVTAQGVGSVAGLP